VSVCIPTYRRPGPLAAALERLTKLEAPAGGYEIVVVDDGSPRDDGVLAVLEAAAAAASVPVRWTSFPENRGPAAARNEAAYVARGDWLAYTDDDCQAQPDWLVRLVDRATETGADVVQGHTIPDPERAHLLTQPWVRSISAETLNDYFHTCNVLYRRSLFEQIDGFDESFRLACDDTDLGWRAVEAGAEVSFADEAVVAHDVVVRDFLTELRSRKRWAGTVLVVRRHPKARRLAWKPYIYRRSHAPVLAVFGSAPLLLFRRTRRLWVLGVLGLLASDVARARTPARAVLALQRRATDAYEIGVLAKESARQRTLLL
jgi:GT2 family glycosyltransferase